MARKTGSAGRLAIISLFHLCLVSAKKNMTAPATGTTITAMPSATGLTNTTAATATAAAIALNATILDCFVTLPSNALTAQGLSTPFQLMPPCSQAVSTQQSFVEAAIFDPATGDISIYHPLIIDFGKKPAVAPVVPALPANAVVALWFGFNGGTLQQLDVNGKDANQSPILKGMGCVNGLPGVEGDVFGQVSWCNTVPFFAAVNPSVASGKTQIPPLGNDKNGNLCPSARSFEVVDQDQSDNLPTQYLLLADGTTIQDTAANRAAHPGATVINNASDEALIGDILDPLIGCTPFKVNSLDDVGATTSSLVTQELQAGKFQTEPIAIVPKNDPDCVLTSNGDISLAKTNAYRIGVNQPLLGTGPGTDPGDLVPYCDNLLTFAPPFLQSNMAAFLGATTPDDGIGNNLFTFLCNRYLTSFTLLGCPPNNTQPVSCQFDGNGAATSCTIKPVGGTGGGAGGNNATTSAAGSGKGAGGNNATTSAAGSGKGAGGSQTATATATPSAPAGKAPVAPSFTSGNQTATATATSSAPTGKPPVAPSFTSGNKAQTTNTAASMASAGGSMTTTAAPVGSMTAAPSMGGSPPVAPGSSAPVMNVSTPLPSCTGATATVTVTVTQGYSAPTATGNPWWQGGWSWNYRRDVPKFGRLGHGAHW